ncbi:MAG: MarC family protein [Chlamydiota bacterium]
MDPIGNVPIFVSVLKNVKSKRQCAIIFRELVIALIIIISFYFIGDFLLSALSVTEDAVMISGGIILFLIALKMIFPTEQDLKTDHVKGKEPFIVPLAVPLVAGPAILAAVMIYSKQESNLINITAIILAWVVSTLILLASLFIRKLLGERGIIACERLMGLILTLISVQMFLRGVTYYLNHKS